MKIQFLYSGLACLALSGIALAQGPGIIAIGSTITYGGANTPDTFTATSTFSSTPVLVNGGKVRIWQEQVPTGSNGEWDIFRMETVNGGPIAGNLNAEWNIVVSYTLTKPALFDGTVNQFLINGVPSGPTSNVGNICCAQATNPILPGSSFYNPGGGGVISPGLISNWRQIFSSPYNFLASAGVNVNAVNQFVFALHFTVPQGRPSVSNAISAGGFGGYTTFGPGSWIEIYGSDLAAGPQQWSNNDFRGLTAPTSLSGTSVSIGGQAAFVGYISPGQINAQVPNGVPPGTQNLIVTTPGGVSAARPVTIEGVKAGLLAPANFRIGSTQHVVALLPDGTFVLPPGSISGLTTRRARPGDTLVLYGTGFGAVQPDIAPGQIAAAPNSLVAPFTLTIGGSQATVSYRGLAPTFVGLYQFNVVVPSISASDAAPVAFSLGGVASSQSLAMAVGN